MDKIKIKPLLISAAILILAFTAKNSYSSQGSLAADVPQSLAANAGEIFSFQVKITVPEHAYIYANPKGPGIGKATTIELKLPRGFRLVQVSYPSGEKYTPAGFDDHVFIWKKYALINITLYTDPSVNAGTYSLPLNLNMLQCTDVCTPFDKDYSLKVIISGSKKGQGTSTQNSDLPGAGSPHPVSERIDTLPAEFSSLTPVCIDKKITGIIQAILLGILAGFILNLMPCVLPVVSLKVMALIHHKEIDGRYSQRNHGLIFSAGIIVSFLLLAMLASFSGYKWGGLFQQTFFVSAMTVFVFIMALSLFGVFTINIPGFAGKAASRQGSGYSDSFIKGILATLLATPCSGPFLGGVLAWAFLQPAHIIFLIFTFVGFGMALPYIMISLIPALARFVPRPGSWMNTLEAVMGFILVFTSIYLLSFLGHDSAVSTLVFIVFVSMGLWQYGKFGNAASAADSRMLSAAVLAVLIVTGSLVSFWLLAPPEHRPEEVKFSIGELLANRDSGRITVVSFTADWCPNCKLVEKTTLNSRKVRGLLADESVIFMKADITQKNPAAEELMSRLGSGSIPFLAVFPPGSGFTNPVCMRDIYSANDVESALELAKKYTKK